MPPPLRAWRAQPALCMPPSSSERPTARRPALDDADDAYERVVVPFSRRPRSVPTPDDDERRFAMSRRAERGAPAGERRVRRRRQRTSWLQRNALSLAALALLVALVGAGFALVQILSRWDGSLSSQGAAPAAATAAVPETTATVAPGPVATSAPVVREIRATVRALEPNYTVAPQDTLVSIAARFNTTVQRIQALNNLPDPRVLNVGQKLVIPPPL